MSVLDFLSILGSGVGAGMTTYGQMAAERARLAREEAEREKEREITRTDRATERAAARQQWEESRKFDEQGRELAQSNLQQARMDTQMQRKVEELAARRAARVRQNEFKGYEESDRLMEDNLNPSRDIVGGSQLPGAPAPTPRPQVDRAMMDRAAMRLHASGSGGVVRAMDARGRPMAGQDDRYLTIAPDASILNARQVAGARGEARATPLENLILSANALNDDLRARMVAASTEAARWSSSRKNSVGMQPRPSAEDSTSLSFQAMNSAAGARRQLEPLVRDLEQVRGQLIAYNALNGRTAAPPVELVNRFRDISNRISNAGTLTERLLAAEAERLRRAAPDSIPEHEQE